MDYSDNDYEGQNLHLAGEETSKISSVLRPFALPKFDFDDSLHGHLRFDSLVENEVFLGIPSQDDNQWIEDFSRGGSEIEFSSRAAESCALPRHINVWSEATSSESVEMLLKAVGQDEMVPGENMIEESDPGDQLGSSTRSTENSLRQDCKVDDVDNGDPSLPPAEVEGNISRLNQSTGVEGVHTEHIIQVQEKKVSFYGVHVDIKEGSLNVTSANSNADTMRTLDNQGETRDLVDESLSNLVQEKLPVLGMEIDNIESSAQNVDVSVKESVDQDIISDSSFVSPSGVAKGISDSVEEQDERCNKNDDSLGETAAETVNTERHDSHEVRSGIESLKEDHAVIIPATEFEEVSRPVKGDYVATIDGCNEVVFVVEPASGSQQETGNLSSATEINHLSEGYSLLHEKSSISLQEEDNERLGTEGNDVVASALYSNYEKEQVPVIQSSDQHDSCAVNENVFHGSNSSLMPIDVTVGSSMLHAVPGNPSEEDGQSNNADGPCNPTSSSFAGECLGEESVIDDMTDARDTAAIQEEDIHDEDHVPPPLISGSTQTCTEDIISMPADAHESELDVPANEKEENKLPLDSSNILRDDNEKEVGSTPIGEKVEGETTTGSEPNNSASDCPVMHTEVEVVNPPSCAEGDELVDGHERKQPSCDTQSMDQSKENETEAPTSTLPSKEILESNELASGTETDKAEHPLLCSAVGEAMAIDQSVSLEETSSVTIPDEACKVLNKEMEHSANDLMVQDDGAEAAHIEEPMDVETERNPGKESLTVSVTSCTVEIDKSKQIAVLSPSGGDLSQKDINEGVSRERNDVENIGKVPTTSEIPEVNVLSKQEGSFTFDVKLLEGQVTGDSSKGLQSFPRIKACKMSLTGEESSSTSGSSQTDPMTVKEITNVGSSPGGPRGPSERKPRRSSSKSGKGSASKGNQLKEMTPLRQTEKWDKSSPFLSPLGAGQIMTFENIVKSRGPVSIPTSSLPDLNTSAPSSAFFQQPFTDLQQVQLRAQIFVYGSLIQGAAPDEAHMVSAFDGGRSIWETSWRACVERLHGQKMQGNNSETPVPSRSGAKAPDHTNRQGFPQSEVLTSMAGRASNKTMPSPVVNPMMSLSSPLWTMSTPSSEALAPSSMVRSAVVDYQAVSPLNPYQTPPIRNYIAQTTWPSQAPFAVPWLASSQSSPASTSYPAFPITESVKLTSVKESSLPISSGAKHASPIPANRTGDSTMFGEAPSQNLKKGKVSTGQTADKKTRKRKKSSGAEDSVEISVSASLPVTVSSIVPSPLSDKGAAVEDISQISFIARNQANQMPRPVVSSHYSTSVAVTTPFSFVPKGTTNQFFTVASPSISSDHLKRGDVSTDKRALLIGGSSNVEEAKLHAQEAAAHATATVTHCESIWSQLDQQKSSGLTSEAESKLAFAAVAMAAAASVAKAAAAAAKIASSVAVQAKHMADEALTKSGTNNPPAYDSILTSSSMNVGNASPVSIFKGGDRNSVPNLAITAAREAARKRIEAASAATRHAEILDAIVKAAELSAEAVSHTGKIVAMGDPFSLSELAEAGLNNYWKASQVAIGPGSKPNDTTMKKSLTSNAGGVPNVYVSQHERPGKDMLTKSDLVAPIQMELPRTMVDDHVTVEENLIASITHEDGSLEHQKDKKVPESAKTAGVVSEPDTESGSNLFSIARIQAGSHVEVLKDRGDLRPAWFSASVFSLRDGEALVCYTELSDEGSDPLKEWISIEAKDGEAPKVRIPHPMTTLQFEGTKKRRRAAIKDYTWSVGDRVDAWVQDCWREGIIAEKNKKDATTLTVNFPAQGETLLVKVWHLRPTLIWNDGQWIECARPGQDSTNQGDTPQEKRPKLETSSMEAKGKAKMAKNIDFVEIERNEEPRLPLSANEKVFNMGTIREENKPTMLRTMRSGLQKEGSRVVFGVPKPGKKRKFMEVSKHYVSDRSTKTNVPNDSAKLAKYLMPQGTGSRGLKSNSRIDLKDKQVVAESRPRALKSDKPPSIPSRTIARKDESTSSRPNSRGAAVSDHLVKGSTSNDENESGEENLAAESGSLHNDKKTAGGPIVFSAQALAQQNRKKAATRNIASQRLHQGRPVAPSAGGRLTNNETNENVDSEVAEPRRSNRRIQPTSRLLEGLQSSLVISKTPSSSHDKSQRSLQNKSTTNRGNNSRG
ncbi:hypothetical protein ABFX02_01G097200 [Erythranthe guttata]